MKVTMADINKKANAIVNEVAESGKVAQIFKHGVAIAEIRPLTDSSTRRDALNLLRNVIPTKVGESIDSVIAAGRQRGV
jgi:antitoxin (DNA-binding transcriptional repressor) of toxin-antitoxin stability system